jgi:hypothetical protein
MEIDPEIISHVENFIDRTRHLPGVNIRFILGRYSTHFGFEPHIFQKEKYDEIKSFLESCVSWEEHGENEIEIENENENERGKNLDCEKNLDEVILCTNGSYDLIVINSLNSNVNVNIFGSRKIILFKRKNHAFVLSTIKNELNELYYTFEIIANIPFNYTSKYISDSSLLKVQDIITKVNPELNLNFKIIK